eukprot:SAG11_NODE_223_length_12120_cov_6.351884_2_plen_87_part_00
MVYDSSLEVTEGCDNDTYNTEISCTTQGIWLLGVCSSSDGTLLSEGGREASEEACIAAASIWTAAVCSVQYDSFAYDLAVFMAGEL